jgi:TonB family protein
VIAALLTVLLAQISPAPSPTANQCSHDAEIVKAVEPDPAHIAAGSPDLFAIVAVSVAPNGSVEKAKIYRSSGDLFFDQASVHAARQSIYRPKVANCEPVEGIVYFRTSLTQGYPPAPGDQPTPPVWPQNVSPPPSPVGRV